MMMTKLGRSHGVNDFQLDFDGNDNDNDDIHAVGDSDDLTTHLGRTPWNS